MANNVVNKKDGLVKIGSVLEAENTGGFEDSIIYVEETQTVYKYLLNPFIDRNGTGILNTIDGDTSKWYGIMGEYSNYIKSYTFNNGITKDTSNNVSLGGYISSDGIFIDGIESNYYEFNISNSTISLQGDIGIRFGTSSNGLMVRGLTTGYVEIDDNTTNKNGLVYSTDLSGTFIDNSLVNKKYVDDKFINMDIVNINLSNTTFVQQEGIIKKNNNLFLHDFNYGDNGTVTTLGGNLFLGENAGNLTMGSTATTMYQSSKNIGIGSDSLVSVTTGSGNVSIGYQSLSSITSGNNNISIGEGSMSDSVLTSSNISIGKNSLKNSSSTSNIAIGDNVLEVLYRNDSSYNVSIGRDSMQHLDIGSENLSLGYGAGSWWGYEINPSSTYDLTESDRSIFIGDSSKAKENVSSNEIVIGCFATGSGSNTATIGNGDTLKTVLRGYLETDDINLTDTTFNNQKGIIKKDSVPFLHNFNYGDNGTIITQGFNVFLGKNIGNFTMGSTATVVYQSSRNIGIGSDIMGSITTGYNNISIGSSILTIAEDVESNIAIGLDSLKICKSSYNIAIGTRSLTELTIDTGFDGYNIAIGPDSLRYLQHGGDNVAIGYGAGMYYGPTETNPNLKSYANVLIGDYCRPFENDTSYETVIGSYTIGHGSNTTTIGNNDGTHDNTDTYLTGRLHNTGSVQFGDDSTSPTADNVGTIRYRETSNDSFVEMCVRTGSTTYNWVVLHTETWA